MLHVAGYCGLLLIEAVSVGTSVSSHTGNEALAAMIVGILASIPTANYCADRLFTRLNRGYDGEQTV
jgi:branched-subunit amino acid ABC-type transport system permease component